MIILDRLIQLGSKLVSIKGLAWVCATIFKVCGDLDTYWWVVFTLLLIGYRALEKILVPRK
jgi:hypothetical protein